MATSISFSHHQCYVATTSITWPQTKDTFSNDSLKSNQMPGGWWLKKMLSLGSL